MFEFLTQFTPNFSYFNTYIYCSSVRIFRKKTMTNFSSYFKESSYEFVLDLVEQLRRILGLSLEDATKRDPLQNDELTVPRFLVNCINIIEQGKLFSCCYFPILCIFLYKKLIHKTQFIDKNQ